MSNFLIYVSHLIRGIKGADATQENKIINCKKAKAFTEELRIKFPDINFYSPAEHEFPPVGYFLRKNYVTIQQVLDVDCEIISECNMVLAWSPDQYISDGMLTELIHASATGKDCAVVCNIYEAIVVINAALLRRGR